MLEQSPDSPPHSPPHLMQLDHALERTQMPGENSPSDESLALRVQSGDTESFVVLVERYEKKLLRYGRKFLPAHEDIQDIVQQVFMRSYQNMRSFNASQKFSPWIYRIAHNAFVNGLRKNKRSKISFVDFDTFFAHPMYEDSHMNELEQDEIRRMVNESLDQIPPTYKEVLILYYVEEMSYKDIAEILKVPTGTVGVRLKRAKELLKKAYERYL